MKFQNQEEEKLASTMFEILGGMQNPNFVCDQKGKILFANKKYMNLVGEIHKNTPFWKICPLTTSIPDYFKSTVEQDVETRSEITFKENSYIIRAIPVKNILAEKRIYMVYFEDITSQIRLNTLLISKQKLLEKSFLDTILTISEIVESRDVYTSGHQKRVALLAINIAVQANITDQSLLNSIYYGALMHDIGKIAIPVEYLVTPRHLTKYEYEIVKTHVSIGYKIIGHMHFPWDVKSVIYQHHERLDGSGYPLGLKEDEISIPAKIVAIADVYEAMSTDRPYRKLIPQETILLHLKENRGKLFDSHYIDCFFQCLSELNDVYEINPYYSEFERFNA
ncbi:MAG: HD domain-containing phosphohydrolase [Legionella sp.]|nr:HD domain-containing phosphohydrolase [Legionella sp.]